VFDISGNENGHDQALCRIFKSKSSPNIDCPIGQHGSGEYGFERIDPTTETLRLV